MSGLLDHLVAEFRYQKRLGERALDQVTDDELFARAGPDDNSLAILVQHLAGNMRSRWTRVFEEDGEKPDRRRDGEFVDTLATRAELVRRWEEGWQYLLGFLGSIGEPDLARTVRVRGNEVPLAASLVRQLGHYAYHVGQMVYRAKAFRGPDWVSLTIPRGESERYLGKGPGSAGGSAESSPGLSR